MRTLTLALLLCTVLASCGSENDANRAAKPEGLGKALDQAWQRGVLKVAMEPTFPPFEYVEGGELQGFDVELARELAAALGVEVEFVRVEWAGIIATLKTAKAEMIISGMTRTDKRAEQVAFSTPYFHTSTCLLVSKERAADVKGIQDLNDPERTVVVKLGTTGETAARRVCPKAKIVPLPDEVTAAAEVANGRADAMLYDRRSIRLHHAKYPERTFAILDPVTIEPYAIALRLGDPQSVAWINQRLAELKQSGRLKELYAKFGIENVER